VFQSEMKEDLNASLQSVAAWNTASSPLPAAVSQLEVYCQLEGRSYGC